MKRIFVPTQSGSDWQRLLGKPSLHWKMGRSAMSAAACWEDANPDLPADVLQTLNASDDPALKDLELLAAIPEWEVDLPGGKRPSQTDVLAVARNTTNLVVIGVEAKVDEAFGPTIGEKRAGSSAGQLERLAYLEKELGSTKPLPDSIRYQLLHRSVSALLTARAFHAPIAVMLVHSFCQASTWRGDFASFCTELSCKQVTADLYEVPNITDRRLLLGWCKGNACYLGAELPSAL
ncbi:MAG: hypothetical protein NVV60_14110 [Luteimonas sp.]|nr:hypothetical protein [Luteimonas sp.]